MFTGDYKTHTKELSVSESISLQRLHQSTLNIWMPATQKELMDKKYSAFRMKVCLFLSVPPLFPVSKQTAQRTEEAKANNGIKIRAGCTEPRGKQMRDWPRGLVHPMSPPQPGQVLALVKTSFLNKETSFLSHRILDFLMSF